MRIVYVPPSLCFGDTDNFEWYVMQLFLRCCSSLLALVLHSCLLTACAVICVGLDTAFSPCYAPTSRPMVRPSRADNVPSPNGTLPGSRVSVRPELMFLLGFLAVPCAMHQLAAFSDTTAVWLLRDLTPAEPDTRALPRHAATLSSSQALKGLANEHASATSAS